MARRAMHPAGHKMVGETPGLIPGFPIELSLSGHVLMYPFALPPVVWMTTFRSRRVLLSPS